MPSSVETKVIENLYQLWLLTYSYSRFSPTAIFSELRLFSNNL